MFMLFLYLRWIKRKIFSCLQFKTFQEYLQLNKLIKSFLIDNTLSECTDPLMLWSPKKNKKQTNSPLSTRAYFQWKIVSFYKCSKIISSQWRLTSDDYIFCSRKCKSRASPQVANLGDRGTTYTYIHDLIN